MSGRSNTKHILIFGLFLFLIETILLLLILSVDHTYALKILSMIGACQVGGRLAFISTGFELGLTTIPIIIVIILYNTAYLLTLFSLFVIFSKQVYKFQFIKSIQSKALNGRRIFNNWSLISIAIFVWIPLPLTGAVIGSIISHLEGYPIKKTLLVSLFSMWIGVVSWTVAFDELYNIIRQIKPESTIIITSLLLIAPLVFNLIYNQYLQFNNKRF